jgi:hypothetical protein
MPEGARVRVVRSYYGYPTFINDGIVIYEGVREQVRDSDVLNLYERVYYTAFVIDPNGRTSSGAIAQVIANVGTFVQPGVPGVIILPSFQSDDQSGQIDGDEIKKNIVSFNMPEPGQITITQLTDMFTMASDTIPLSSDMSFTVAIASEEIAGDFTTIVATLSDPRGSGKAFSFLLRLNSDRTRYEATIAAIQFVGRSDFMVEIYDYNSLVVARYVSQIVFTPGETVASSTLEVLWWRLVTAAWYGLLVVPFLVVLLLWFVYRRREAEG